MTYHKLRIGPDMMGNLVTACGLVAHVMLGKFIRIESRWKNVTCKNCLKKKGN